MPRPKSVPLTERQKERLANTVLCLSFLFWLCVAAIVAVVMFIQSAAACDYKPDANTVPPRIETRI